MNSRNTKETTLNTRLFEDDDSEEYLEYKGILHNVAAHTISPSEGALHLDEWVTRGANERLERTQGCELTQEEQDSLYLVWPNPARHFLMLFRSIATMCSAWHPDHPAQNALIELLHELKRLPKHQVPCLLYDDSHEPYLDKTYTIWPIGDDNFSSTLSQEFRQEVEDIAYPYSEVETPGSDFQLRWRNLQAFTARLTTEELLDCSSSSALVYILPSSHVYPDLEQRKIGGANRLAADILAAEGWLRTHQARKWVYEHCKDGGGKVWNMENWCQWKQQMTFVNGDERFRAELRTLAQSLKKKMEEQQAK